MSEKLPKRELHTISLEDAYQDAFECFQHLTEDDKKAFLVGFYLGKRNGHRDAYMLCSLAKFFPPGFVKDGKVVSPGEIIWDGPGKIWDERNAVLQESLLDYFDFVQYEADRQLIARLAGDHVGINVVYEVYRREGKRA